MPSSAEHPSHGERTPETRLTSDERVELIRAGLDRWREGFLAYLLLPDVDLSNPHMQEQFVDSYAGWYPDQHAFTKAQIETLGWADALDEFRTAHGIPDGALDIDWDLIWDHCHQVYDLVEQLGGVHVFMR